MRPTIAFFVFALLGLLVGSVLGGGISLRLRYDDVRVEVDQEKERLQSEWELKEIAVANDELAEGDVLLPQFIAVKQFPAKFVTPSFLTPEEAHDLAGNQVTSYIALGDPLIRQQVVGADGGATCAPVETVEAYIAKHAISAGTELEPMDFEPIRIPKRLVTPSVINTLYDVSGSTITHDMEAGDLLTRPFIEDSIVLDGGDEDEGVTEDEP